MLDPWSERVHHVLDGRFATKEIVLELVTIDALRLGVLADIDDHPSKDGDLAILALLFGLCHAGEIGRRDI